MATSYEGRKVELDWRKDGVIVRMYDSAGSWRMGMLPMSATLRELKAKLDELVLLLREPQELLDEPRR